MSESILENLNRTMKKLMATDEKIILIGEDIADPYGGAFKVFKGLSVQAPDRVISTPISEEGFTNMAAGMAIRGYKPIVDLMFSDFMALIFDPLVNFASKCVSISGARKKINLIVRCANGGYRGYGPTHSQSMQKYFMGIPNLSVYEMTPFHDSYEVFMRMLRENIPCVFFEEKSLYSGKMYMENIREQLFTYELKGKEDNWAAVSSGAAADVAVICHGGLAEMCIQAAKYLLIEHEIETCIYIPSKLYPSDIGDIYQELRAVSRILIVEEGTRGATWGGEMMADIYCRYGKEDLDIHLLSSVPAIIPASCRYENTVLMNEEKIVAAVADMVSGS